MTPLVATERRQSAWALWGPPLLYMAMIFGLSTQSQLPSPPGRLTDKHVHFLVFGGLSALLLRALARGEWRRVTVATVVGAIVLTAVYGASDELHQSFVPGRDASVLDAVADALGASAAASLLWAWGIIRDRRLRR
ncbi:MAG: VanZ family protein [Vicinamibacterales bacterium]